jgi:hypothetical protein
MSPQPLLNPTAFYPTYIDAPPVDAFPALVGEGDFTAINPNFFTGWIQYKHKKLAIAPTFALAEGVSYGSPGNIYGLDPRTCSANQGATGADENPLYASYADYFTCGATIATASGYLAVPDPYTGTFDGLGQYHEPWQLKIGAQIRYDISPRVTMVLNVANIYNTCFGGSSTPWSKAYPAGQYVCSYDNSGVTTWPGIIPGEGFFYGASPSDPANGTAGFPGPFRFPYQPQYPPAGLGSSLPLQAYLEFLIKL